MAGAASSLFGKVEVDRVALDGAGDPDGRAGRAGDRAAVLRRLRSAAGDPVPVLFELDLIAEAEAYVIRVLRRLDAVRQLPPAGQVGRLAVLRLVDRHVD